MDRVALRTLLLDVLADVTGENRGQLLDEQTLQEQLHLDSLDLMSTAIELHARTGVTLEVADVSSIATVGELLDVLLAKMPAIPSTNKAA